MPRLLRPTLSLCLLALLAACSGERAADAPADAAPPTAPDETQTPAAADDAVAGVVDENAPAAETPPPAETSLASAGTIWRFDCGDTPLAFFRLGDDVQLGIDGRRIELRAAESASGARFEGEDEGRPVEFWNKGEEASLRIGDETLPTCRLAGEVTSAPYRALGQEPSWLLKLSGEQLTISLDHGQRTVQVVSFARIDEDGGFRLQGESEAGAVSLSVRRAICRDSMSGMPHPDTVTLKLGETELAGCGGDPAELLRGADWRIVEIDGAPALDGIEADFRFGEDGRLEGKASCNQMSGQWQLGGERLSLGPMASTKMYCADPGVMEQERAVMAVLNDSPGHDFDAEGRLVLTGQGGGKLVAVR
jgi:heat shock protein HslJ/membrane-bound inhibitor of C-type lysozyme